MLLEGIQKKSLDARLRWHDAWMSNWSFDGQESAPMQLTSGKQRLIS